jgi:hypothetical protein
MEKYVREQQIMLERYAQAERDRIEHVRAGESERESLTNGCRLRELSMKELCRQIKRHS